MARIRLEGLGNALRAVARVPAAMRQARDETLREWADNVQNTAAEKAPRDRGELYQAIDQRVNTHFGRADVGVWQEDQLEYALYVEKGTSKMNAQPYLVPAFNDHRRQVTRTYRAAFRRHIGGG
ncbi:HK97 gp10 family phage protein [Streptomyces caniscabiei]|uniref:HK97-gp10 family putative phage morphogenesis protein n=1 Tax=Streptomyces caniscabiei TaxID=2746961 RepID=UPI0029A95851|nr:HK97-gp10 family putative phage morphogenesis protein [Streptomyces caniscabiei]MDX3507366.1 HK97 gp10 family phage protein [Streptomyces caniscabiei]